MGNEFTLRSRKRNLLNLFLFKESFKINDVISPVFINKFCEELEACSASVIDDLAAALDLAETFQNFRCGFEVLFCGVFSSKKQRNHHFECKFLERETNL